MDDQDLRAHLDAYLSRFATLVPPAPVAPGELDRPARRTRRFVAAGLRRPLLSALVAVAVVASMVLLLIGGFGLRDRAQPEPQNPLFAGPAAQPVANATRMFVWLTGMSFVNPSQPCGTCVPKETNRVDVLDWTGAVRYHFDLSSSTAPRNNEIETISADGTRALLSDGRVLDERGKVVGHLAVPSSAGLAASYGRWLSNDTGVCMAISNEPSAEPTTAPAAPEPPKGSTAAPGASPAPLPPYALPGANHSVTLKLYMLNGQVRTIATVGSGPLGEGSGALPDSTSVLSCNPSTDLAVIARYHDAGNDFSSKFYGGDTTVSLWAIKLSTGAVLFHQPETRMADGRPFFFGSENGALAVEFLWNSRVLGSETDTVLHIPSGTAVPVLDNEPSPDTPALSADGTRILRRVENAGNTRTTLELVDATSGRIIRAVVIDSGIGAAAVADPSGSSFLVEVEGQLALVDGNGGISALSTTAPLSGANAVGLAGRPGTQG
jgi:hypothetical protein